MVIVRSAWSEEPDWRFCTIGAIGSEHVFISQPFRDGRLSQALESAVERAVREVGIEDDVIQCRQPTNFAEAMAARNHAVDVNRQVGTDVVDIHLETKVHSMQMGGLSH